MSRVPAFLRVLVLATTVVFLATEVLQGLLRHLVGDSALVAVLYAPKAVMATLIALHVVISHRISRASLPFATALFTWTVIGLIVLGDPIQTGFGLWLLIPLIYGFVFGKLLFAEAGGVLRFWLLGIWALAASGLAFNYFNELPWAGAELTVLGHDVEGAREWSTQGISRLSGFSRASYFVAAQLLMLAILLMPAFRRRTARIALWLAAGLGVIITTSKGPIAAWLFCSLYYLAAAASLRRTAALMPVAVAMVSFTLPLLFIGGGAFVDFGWLGLEDEALNLLLNSLIERFTSGWPEAFQYIADRGLYLTGTGIGGNGTAMKLFDAEAYILVDNIMVALYVGFGIWAAVPLLWFMSRISPFGALRAMALHRFQAPLALALSAIGLTAYLFEDPVMALLLGALVQLLAHRSPRPAPMPIPADDLART